jgi:predicted dehydrogenase
VGSSLWVSAVAAQQGPRLRVLGSCGAYVVDGLDGQEDALRAGLRPAGADDWGTEPEERWGTAGAGDDIRRIRTERGDYGVFYAGVEASLRRGVPPPVDPEDSWQALRIIEAARLSAAERRVVSMD